LRRIRKSRIWTAKIATATATAVRKLTMPIPLSLSAALVDSGVSPIPPPEDVLVGSSDEVPDALSVSEAEIAEDRRELTIELVTEAAVPVAESVADAETSESVDDMLKLKPSTVWNF
jgi:hypothetical protein